MDLPSGQEKVRKVRSMFDAIAPRYDLVNRLMTFGMDVGWRRKTVASLGLQPGSIVIDVACGTGDLCRQLRSTRHTAIGVDMSLGMLQMARTTAPLVLGDALSLPFRDRSAHGVTCGFAMRNVADLQRLFDEFARVVVPDGRIAILEVAQPDNALIKRAHSIYFNNVVPMIGGIVSDKEAYTYLPRSVDYLPAHEQIQEMLVAAGFEGLKRRSLSLGAAQLITGMRK